MFWISATGTLRAPTWCSTRGSPFSTDSPWNTPIPADLAGTGVRPNASTAEPWYSAHGARACGFPLVAGLIRVEEIEAGRIDRALVVAHPHSRAGGFTPPASTAQARVGDDSGALSLYAENSPEAQAY
jgi:hypothetical protein